MIVHSDSAGMTLRVDLAAFADEDLHKALSLVHVAAGHGCEAGRPWGDLLLAVAVGLDDARHRRRSALDELQQHLDDDDPP